MKEKSHLKTFFSHGRINKRPEFAGMEEMILVFKDAIIFLSGKDSIIILADDVYILDGKYREKIQLVDLK